MWLLIKIASDIFIYQSLKTIVELHQKENIDNDIPDTIVVHYHQSQQPAGTLQKA